MFAPRWLAAGLLLVSSFALAQGCFFTLAPLAGSGGGGASASAGGGGSGATVSYEVEVTYASFTGGAVSDFVLMVPIGPSDIDYAATTSDGADLRFVDAQGTSLPHEIELWSPGGRSIAWVKVPTMSPSGGSFFLRYGDPAAPGGPSPEEVWSSYVAVHHLGEDFGQNELAADASGNGPSGTPTMVASADTSLIGRGAELTGETAPGSGVGSVIDFGEVATWQANPGEQRTISVWFARETTNPDGMQLFSSKTNCCGGWALLVLGDIYANLRSDVTVGSCCTMSSSSFDTTPFAMPDGADDLAWHHYLVVLDRDAGTHQLYLDGELRDEQPFVSGAAMGASAGRIGASEYAADFTQAFVDETRVGAFAASADWARLRYVAESTDGFVTFGLPQRLPAN
ncbi:MAG: DUF2341 domain-containing protein [Myxococcales bacterium]|nr:DUF2341 domain-containing protein [Myxococcales bacterium]